MALNPGSNDSVLVIQDEPGSSAVSPSSNPRPSVQAAAGMGTSLQRGASHGPRHSAACTHAAGKIMVLKS